MFPQQGLRPRESSRDGAGAGAGAGDTASAVRRAAFVGCVQQLLPALRGAAFAGACRAEGIEFDIVHKVR